MPARIMSGWVGSNRSLEISWEETVDRWQLHSTQIRIWTKYSCIWEENRRTTVYSNTQDLLSALQIFTGWELEASWVSCSCGLAPLHFLATEMQKATESWPVVVAQSLLLRHLSSPQFSFYNCLRLPSRFPRMSGCISCPAQTILHRPAQKTHCTNSVLQTELQTHSTLNPTFSEVTY